MAHARTRLSDAADGALVELLDDLRQEVITQAQIDAESSVISAADVVRAYYRVLPSNRSNMPSDSASYRRDRGRRLSRLAFSSAVAIMVIGVSLVALGVIFERQVDRVFSVIGVSYTAIGSLMIIILVLRSRKLRRRKFERIRFLSKESVVSGRGDSDGPPQSRSEATDQADDVVDRSRSVFLARWWNIEGKIGELYAEHIDPPSEAAKRPFGAVVNELRVAGVLSDALNRSLVSLLKVRNNVVHSRDLPADMESLLVDLAFVDNELSRLIVAEGDLS